MRSDEQLMDAYVQGDSAAFDAIYRRYHPVLLGVMRRYLSSVPDAEDLVQHTFLKLHRARESYRAGTPLRPWLFMIARNVRKDHLRSLMRSCESPGDVDSAPVADDPSETLEARERASEVRAALRKLSGTLRRTAELHWLEDCSFEEIARREGILQGTARVRAHRACAQMRRMLDDQPATAEVIELPVMEATVLARTA
jgi:RNA polymerase sigma factor (sigma-70 family)